MSEPELGVNFSHRQALWLGLDPLETFTALLNETRVRLFRLSLYWEEVQPEPTRYDFSTLHEYLDIAERRRARVLLTVGLKAQRHPEFYPPSWLFPEGVPPRDGQISERPRLVANLLLMLERAVALLADYSAIDSWQVENEPFLPAAGRTVGWRFDAETLQKEIAAVRGSDSRHRPIVINHSSLSLLRPGWLRALRLGDVLAADVYTRRPLPGRKRYVDPFRLGPFGPALPAEAALARAAGRRFWITELQAEPWENVPIPELLPDEIGSVSPELIERNLRLVRRAAPERVFLWGAEWWYQQRLQGDERYWELVRRLFSPHL